MSFDETKIMDMVQESRRSPPNNVGVSNHAIDRFIERMNGCITVKDILTQCQGPTEAYDIFRPILSHIVYRATATSFPIKHINTTEGDEKRHGCHISVKDVIGEDLFAIMRYKNGDFRTNSDLVVITFFDAEHVENNYRIGKWVDPSWANSGALAAAISAGEVAELKNNLPSDSNHYLIQFANGSEHTVKGTSEVIEAIRDSTLDHKLPPIKAVYKKVNFNVTLNVNLG